jgi:hypothetical protein
MGEPAAEGEATGSQDRPQRGWRSGDCPSVCRTDVLLCEDGRLRREPSQCRPLGRRKRGLEQLESTWLRPVLGPHGWTTYGRSQGLGLRSARQRSCAGSKQGTITDFELASHMPLGMSIHYQPIVPPAPAALAIIGGMSAAARRCSGDECRRRGRHGNRLKGA